ncbi:MULTISPECIES: SDR family NAD(P)-dependent oxidoreductase [Alphaproteobacteria]|jgi:NAD(P)-dependent dehydrogenase (short-subunit alcohol dehydrogenase family)|uniref:SDR family NAD(P)-dependent oxidoreductase n=3 Tax=Rhodobacterales TaxID=204455 RepID=A0A845MAM4_9RHOB|nr:MULTISPECIES: SDR family NAD(P)-dependent oxidoreductase [Rhodobacterales]MEC7795334.1 SDR family NAD(P)-dependent oxidoreductase [Pseudomonadota bacterium]UWS82038.1 SDR family NAD(P)-dependent oxidoreductase [Phaeobacter sp. G2]MCG7630097.1 SDR family NAD(P)-dependent oxidoreductase [Epibacterium sp. MM17-32]MCI5038761.1 SDR family NAD(P)-dependent oxidoreductase [Donghicola eburneus]MDE4063203.1 SDR family NAD(P)-dependent oxidoreductase [Phaeobacter gallaeciensis]
MKIEGKTIIVTGGASGLGAATAEYLHGLGAQVAMFDRDMEQGTALADRLGADRAMFRQVDVTSDEHVSEAISAVVDRFGALHVAINCAGVVSPMKVVDREGAPASLDAFRRTVEINLVGTFNVMSQAAARMLENPPEDGEERGVIVNISSGAAYEGQIGQTAYASSKAGVIGLNLPAARELGPKGIRINAIAPGLFGTPMVMSLGDEVVASLEESVEAPKRVGRMEEFAHACAFLIENSYMNGATLRLDAATRLRAR